MRFLPALSCAAVLFGSISCSGGDGDDQETQVAKLVSIAVNDVGTLMPGARIELTAIATYDDATTKDVSTTVVWSSSNPAVATVEGRTLTVIAAGDTEIGATLGDVAKKVMITAQPLRVTDILLSNYDMVLDRGQTANLTATLKWSNDTEEEGTSKVTWASSNPAAVSIDATGLIKAEARGDATISATFDGQTKTALVTSLCSYPAAGDVIDFGETMPSLYWDAAIDKNGNEFAFSLDEAHCGAEYKDATALIFLISATWCVYCPDYMRAIVPQIEAIERAGGRLVFVEVQDSVGAPADSAEGKAWLDRVIGAPFAISVGDKDVGPRPGVWGSSPLLVAFPSALVVRTSDMKVIADQMRSNAQLPFATIARHTDIDWSDPDNVVIDNCLEDTEEASEPNNRPSQAGALEPGVVVEGGLCDNDDDYYEVTIEGGYRVTLDFDASLADLDIYVYDDVANQVLVENGERVGSYGTTGHEEFAHQGRAILRVEGGRNASAPYRLAVEAL